MMRFLRHELHLHLYGCLTAEDLHHLGRDRARTAKGAARLDWFADEFAKAYGPRPDPQSYWRDDNGLEKLREDFEFTAAESFDRFQARFNLAIVGIRAPKNRIDPRVFITHANCVEHAGIGVFLICLRDRVSPLLKFGKFEARLNQRHIVGNLVNGEPVKLFLAACRF